MNASVGGGRTPPHVNGGRGEGRELGRVCVMLVCEYVSGGLVPRKSGHIGWYMVRCTALGAES